MKGPDKKPTVQVKGYDGTHYGIMERVRRALRGAGADVEYCNHYLQESMRGDYDNLLITAKKYVEVQ